MRLGFDYDSGKGGPDWLPLSIIALIVVAWVIVRLVEIYVLGV